MGSSYKEASEEYKNNKKKLIDGYEDVPHKRIKKNKKKNKRSSHKHKYIPAIYNMSYKRIDNTYRSFQVCGEHCEICGRIKELRYLWFDSETKVQKFKKEYPHWIEITLPNDWDYFKDKYIPI